MRQLSILRVLALVGSVVVIVACGCSTTRAPEGTVVHTASGSLRGEVDGDHLLFAGVPYAAPPLNQLRWRPPQPAPRWDGTRDATKYGPSCPQDTSKEPDDVDRIISEDCLTLNIWAPKAPSATPRPVMVWIHGGAFIEGSGDVFNAGRLATRGDIVVVTINYRLGALGFLAHPALATDGGPGNYGFEDQQAALRWVHDNIASFGGDPAKVTIAGESAGAMSVCDHLVAPGSAGLFRAGILQSGPCQAQSNLPTAQRVSLDYAVRLGCADPGTAAACLRALPVEKLEDPPLYYPFGGGLLTGPITGTPALPVDPITAFTDGTAARVPVLIGTNQDEWTVIAAEAFVEQGRMPDYQQALAVTFGADSGRIAQLYPLNWYANSAMAYSAAATDGLFACPAYRMEMALAKEAKVYAYEFSDRDSPEPKRVRDAPFRVGAAHALEVHYLFGPEEPPLLSSAQRLLSDRMIRYWTSFVTTGAPHAEGAPEWPAFAGAQGPWMSLETPEVRVFRTFDADHQCAFWATVALPH